MNFLNSFYTISHARFKVVDLLTMASQHQNAVLDSEQERPMLEGALTFLVILTSLRVHLGKWFTRGFTRVKNSLQFKNRPTLYFATVKLSQVFISL